MVNDKVWKELKAVSTPIDPPHSSEIIAEAVRLLEKYGCPVSPEIAIASGLIIQLVERERLELLDSLRKEE